MAKKSGGKMKKILVISCDPPFSRLVFGSSTSHHHYFDEQNLFYVEIILIPGKMITDIQRAWNGLLGAEKGFEEWLLAELMRLGKNHLYYAFKK